MRLSIVAGRDAGAELSGRTVEGRRVGAGIARVGSERPLEQEGVMSKRGRGDRKKARRATRDLTARKAGAVKGQTKTTGGGAGKVNVQDLAFTHYQD